MNDPNMVILDELAVGYKMTVIIVITGCCKEKLLLLITAKMELYMIFPCRLTSFHDRAPLLLNNAYINNQNNQEIGLQTT